MKKENNININTTTKMLLPLLLSTSLLYKGHALNISSVEEFITFTNEVNNGTNYKGETVFLTSDLDFTIYSSSSFVPVGKSNDAYTFRGIFDGQGHAISNLKVASDKFLYLGVFGYSNGATIKNLVVDSSCSFESSYSGGNSCAIGGIFGWCKSNYGECTLEGCVSMASIKYSGSSSATAYIGGIVGKIEVSDYNTSITDCMNYGNVSSVSSESNELRIGGIAGEVYSSRTTTSTTSTIKNCLNFGPLTQSGYISNRMCIGGISSVDNNKLSYENCVSLGAISYNKGLGCSRSIGAISGISTSGTFKDCFWDSEIGLNAAGSWSGNITIQENVEAFDFASLSENTTVLSILNNGGGSGGGGVWCLVTFNSNGGSVVDPVLIILGSAASKTVEALPKPVREESTFDGWYSDAGLTNAFNADELRTGSTTLYAKWIVNKYTVIFIVDGKEYSKTTLEFGTSISYPVNPVREGYSFTRWNETITIVPAHDVVIEAQWTINTYTITFIVNGVPTETLQEYGTSISYPEAPTKEGYTFDGWNDTVTTVPAHNVTIKAQWTINTYTVAFTVGGVLNETRYLTYQSPITYPETPTKEGFTFDGWYTDDDFEKEANKSMKVTESITFYGRFVSTIVRIEFSAGGLTREEAAKKIEVITDCTDCFTIVQFDNEVDQPFIIVRFKDVSEAKSFVDIIEK